MPTIKVTDIAYARLRAPDLDVMETFLSDFGLARSARTSTALYMRGSDAAHHLHVTELGPPGFVGLAFYADSLDDLHRLATVAGASPVEDIGEPGGGKRVRLTEPNGFQIEVVHGIDRVEPMPVHRLPLNTAERPYERTGTLLRLPAGPARVKRLGHAALMSPDPQTTVAWFRSTLGFVGSDDVYAGAPDHVIGSFNRVDRGETVVDHHAFVCFAFERAGLNHMAFEVQDVDDVFVGNAFLHGVKRYEHVWGVGRHLIGSQIFDYWSDPWGRIHEHWSDTDRLDATVPMNALPVEVGLSSQWGDPAPAAIMTRSMA